MIATRKRGKRLDKGLCLGCGNKKCSCKKFPKRQRKNIPEVLLKARGRKKYEADLIYQFKALVSRITEIILDETDENRIKARKLKK